MRKIGYTFFFLGFVLTLFCIKAFAQKIEYSLQPIDNYTYDYLKIAGYDDNGFYLLQSNLPFDEERDRVGFKSKKYKASYFTNDLKEKWAREFDKGEEGNRIETIGLVNGNLITVKSKFKDNEDKITVNVYKLDAKGNELPSVINLGDISFQRSSELDKIKFLSSHFHSKFGFIQVEKKEDKTQVLNCIVTDTSLKVLHTLRFDIPYEEKNFYFENWLLTDAGDFILLAYHNSKQNSSDKKRWDAYKLFIAKAGESKAKEISLNTDNIVFSGGNMVYDAVNNKVVAIGFYADKSANNSGLLCASVFLNANDSVNILRQSIKESDQAKLLNTKNINYGAAPLTNYNIEKIVLRNDGGSVIVAEASYVSDYSYYDYFTQSYVRQSEFHFENVIVLSVNADGTIDWDAVLRKDQASINDNGRYSSFCLMQSDEKINIFYNTEIERKNSVAYFSVTNSGDVAEKEFIKAEDRILLIPYAARQISADEIIVPCWSKKKLLLAKITF